MRILNWRDIFLLFKGWSANYNWHLGVRWQKALLYVHGEENHELQVSILDSNAKTLNQSYRQGSIRKTSPFGIIPLVPVAILAENIIYFCIFKSALNLNWSSNRVQLPLFKFYSAAGFVQQSRCNKKNRDKRWQGKEYEQEVLESSAYQWVVYQELFFFYVFTFNVRCAFICF